MTKTAYMTPSVHRINHIAATSRVSGDSAFSVIELFFTGRDRSGKREAGIEIYGDAVMGEKFALLAVAINSIFGDEAPDGVTAVSELLKAE